MWGVVIKTLHQDRANTSITLAPTVYRGMVVAVVEVDKPETDANSAGIILGATISSPEMFVKE